MRITRDGVAATGVGTKKVFDEDGGTVVSSALVCVSYQNYLSRVRVALARWDECSTVDVDALFKPHYAPSPCDSFFVGHCRAAAGFR